MELADDINIIFLLSLGSIGIAQHSREMLEDALPIIEF